MLIQSDDTIRKNLYLDKDDCFWQEWKDLLISTIRKYEKNYQNNFYKWGYCLDSDLDREIETLKDCNISITIVARDNNIIIYEIKE